MGPLTHVGSYSVTKTSPSGAFEAIDDKSYPIYERHAVGAVLLARQANLRLSVDVINRRNPSTP